MRWCFVTTCAVLWFVSLPPSARAGSIPDFVEHWEYGLNVDEDEGPHFFIDPLVPFYRSPTNDRVAFIEPRLSYRDSHWLTNLGIGVRQLVADREWLLGGNVFYDYASEHSHSRVGFGAEALSHYAELRSNVYIGSSRERTVEQTNTFTVFEKAVDGVDVEAGMPIPYYSRLKVYGGFNWYNFEEFKNRYGWTLRTEYIPWPFIVIDGTLSNDTKTNVDWGMTVAFRLPLGGNAIDTRSLQSVFELDETMFPESDMGGDMFRLVERHHEIVVERRRVTGGVSVEIARGN